jgi:hypothetical protein
LCCVSACVRVSLCVWHIPRRGGRQASKSNIFSLSGSTVEILKKSYHPLLSILRWSLRFVVVLIVLLKSWFVVLLRLLSIMYSCFFLSTTTLTTYSAAQPEKTKPVSKSVRQQPVTTICQSACLPAFRMFTRCCVYLSPYLCHQCATLHEPTYEPTYRPTSLPIYLTDLLLPEEDEELPRRRPPGPSSLSSLESSICSSMAAQMRNTSALEVSWMLPPMKSSSRM